MPRSFLVKKMKSKDERSQTCDADGQAVSLEEGTRLQNNAAPTTGTILDAGLYSNAAQDTRAVRPVNMTVSECQQRKVQMSPAVSFLSLTGKCTFCVQI